MRASRSGCTLASRWMVATTYPPGASPSRSRTVDRSRAIGPSRKHASAMTSPTTSIRPGTPSPRRISAERSSGQSSSAATRSTATRFRSSGIDQSPLRRPASTCATGIPASSAASAPASVEFVSPYTSAQSGRSASSAAAIPGRIRSASAVCRSSRYAGSGSPSSSKKTSDSSRSQCWPVCSVTSSMPASRSATASGPDLMNCGRLPTTERTFTSARLQWPPVPSGR